MSHNLTEPELQEWEKTLAGYPEDHHERIAYAEMIAECRNMLAFDMPVNVDDNPRHRPPKQK